MNPRRRLTGPGRVVLQILPVLWKRLFWYTTQHILFIYSPALEDRKDLSLSFFLSLIRVVELKITWTNAAAVVVCNEASTTWAPHFRWFVCLTHSVCLPV